MGGGATQELHANLPAPTTHTACGRPGGWIMGGGGEGMGAPTLAPGRRVPQGATRQHTHLHSLGPYSEQEGSVPPDTAQVHLLS